MKFATLVALVATTSATKIMATPATSTDSSVPTVTTPATATATATANATTSAPANATTDPMATSLPVGMMDQNNIGSNTTYPIDDQNFNGILGMLGTPTSMTSQLHTMFNQIHFNERVMRQIRKIVNDTPELVETLCASGTSAASVNGDAKNQCQCPVGNNILYGAITDEGKIDYMLGFAQDIATGEKTECSDKVFGDPVPDAEKYCWCQEWDSNSTISIAPANTTTNATSTAAAGLAQTYSSHDIHALAQMLK